MPTSLQLGTLSFLWVSLGFSTHAGAQDPAIVRGPYLQALLDTSVVVIWNTDTSSAGKVTSRVEGGAEVSSPATAPDTVHRVSLANLSPGTVYEYQVFDGDRALTEGSFPFHFRTSPLPGDGDIHIAVIGDSGVGSAKQHLVAQVIQGFAPDLFLHTGDLDYTNGNDIDKALFGPYADIFPNTCFYPSRGNHDNFVDWSAVFVSPSQNAGSDTYYSFDWGDAHFVALDTNLPLQDGSGQMSWLVADLEAAQLTPRTWTILFFHDPVYTVGGHADEPEPFTSRLFIPPVAARFGVDLVLSGHDHSYQRSHPTLYDPVLEDVVVDAWHSPTFVSPLGTIYVVTGGGGQIKHPGGGVNDTAFIREFRSTHHAVELVISSSRLAVRAVDFQGELLDAFSITKGAPRPEFQFIRGDANLNGTIDLTDAIVILDHLFVGKPLDCRLAAEVVADVNGSGSLDLADAIFVLSFRFQGGMPPLAPHPDCGTVAAADPTGCTKTGCPVGG